MGRESPYPIEVRERAVRQVLEHEVEHSSRWATIESIAAKIGCKAETLRQWVRQVGRDAGHRPGLTTSQRDHLTELEREVVLQAVELHHFARREEGGALEGVWPRSRLRR
jgi:transposase